MSYDWDYNDLNMYGYCLGYVLEFKNCIDKLVFF